MKGIGFAFRQARNAVGRKARLAHAPNWLQIAKSHWKKCRISVFRFGRFHYLFEEVSHDFSLPFLLGR